jgi:hypothetical protein
MHIRWAAMGRSTDALGVAARRGLSPFRIAHTTAWESTPGATSGRSAAPFVGIPLGLGIGWALLDSLRLGLLLAGAGALIAGWHDRVGASLLAVERHAHDAVEEPQVAERPEVAHQPPGGTPRSSRGVQ